MNTGKTKIMGILNVTPDSFYDGGRYSDFEAAFAGAVQMVDDGADIIDVGGESTRPGSLPVAVEEEIERVCPVIEKISSELDVAISIDTTKSSVAEEALKLGAVIVNDISGMTFDGRMPGVVAKYGSNVVVMHIKGTPENMQNDVAYGDEIKDILDFLNQSVKLALKNGISRDKIIIDPGIGFGKSLDHNYNIIKNLDRFVETGFPVMMALSRKSLIGGIYDNPEADRLPGTIALNSVSAYMGAEYIRVHDVKEHRLAIDTIDYLRNVSV